LPLSYEPVALEAINVSAPRNAASCWVWEAIGAAVAE
jgi:hypothetical protein